MSFDHIKLLVGAIVLVLSGSFMYKAYVAGILGRTYIWTGFLPLTVVSPFILHLPPGKRSLVKQVEGMWVHMLMGPIFFVIALVGFTAGADLMGWPGTDMANKLLTMGQADKQPAIVYTGKAASTPIGYLRSYQFPGAIRAYAKLAKLCSVEINMKQQDKLIQQPTGSYNEAQSNASGQ